MWNLPVLVPGCFPVGEISIALCLFQRGYAKCRWGGTANLCIVVRAQRGDFSMAEASGLPLAFSFQ